jgi:addiction module HigA family antidote
MEYPDQRPVAHLLRLARRKCLRGRDRRLPLKEEQMTNALSPVHPGEILLEEFLRPLGISQYRLAKDTSVPPRRINEIVRGQRSITADTALRLAKFFGTSELFWLNLQARFDLDLERLRLGARLSREVIRFVPAARPSRSRARTAGARSSNVSRANAARKVK